MNGPLLPEPRKEGPVADYMRSDQFYIRELPRALEKPNLSQLPEPKDLYPKA